MMGILIGLFLMLMGLAMGVVLICIISTLGNKINF
jgi:hypothetical protein